MHPLLDAVADLLLGARELELVVQQDEDLLHARQERDGLQDLLELRLGRGGQAGGEVRQVGRVLGTETVEEHAQLFHIEGIEREQLLDGVDDGHGVGLDLLIRRAGRLRDVGHPSGEGRLTRYPGLQPEALQALDQNLEVAVLLVHPVDAAGGADLPEVRGGSLLRGLCVYQNDPQDLVLSLADSLQGCGPVVGVHEQGNCLAWEEGPSRHGQQVDLGGQDVVGSGQDRAAGIGRRLGGNCLGNGLLALVRHVLIGHRPSGGCIPCPMPGKP